MNKKTSRAKKMGFCSQRDQERNGNEIFKGKACDTSWKSEACKRNGPKVYKKHDQ